MSRVRALALRRIVPALLLVAVLSAAPAAGAHESCHHRCGPHKAKLRPLIFVHGGAGSGAQFESQKMRFAGNGYPLAYVQVLEYDSTFSVESLADVQAKLDALVAEVKQDTGRAQVDVLGHSLGTSVMHSYLNSSAERAANVAHYVNIDGRTATSPPGGVPTLALWAGRGSPGRTIEGATNVTIPNQTHVQSATSAESFAEIFKFFTGHRPKTTDVVRDRGWISVAGRAVIFPQNTGVAPGAELTIWRVKRKTGERIGKHPVATPSLGSDGSWGPVRVSSGKRYEFALLRGEQTHHFYYEPFRRSDHLVRLLTQEPGTGLDALQSRSERHLNLIFTRNKEFWGDQGPENDIVEVNGTNVINAAVSPITKRTIAMFAFDQGADGVSDLSAPIPIFFALPFLSAVDIFIPGASPPTGTVSLTLRSRGAGPLRKVRFPNFASTADVVSVQFDDFEH
ncbi:MAG: alpha/beta hydrolase [Solirubrobacterales bacterium]